MGVDALWNKCLDHVIEPDTMGRLRTMGGLVRFFWYSSSIFVIRREYWANSTWYLLLRPFWRLSR